MAGYAKYPHPSSSHQPVPPEVYAVPMVDGREVVNFNDDHDDIDAMRRTYATRNHNNNAVGTHLSVPCMRSHNSLIRSDEFSNPYYYGAPPSLPIVPMPSLSKTKSCVLHSDQKSYLMEELGFPSGLADELGATRSLYPVRFWILDNSGSMMSNDGTSLRGGGGKAATTTVPVPCTRWAELQECVSYHADLAGMLQATTVFRMLNDPGVRCGPQEFSIAKDDDNNEGKNKNNNSVMEDVANARAIMQHCQPSGSTPLTQHLIEIAQRVVLKEEEMRRLGLQAVLVIATDGLPTSADGSTSSQINNDFIEALKELQTLPVWIVIRLCTDDDRVVDFYNHLDRVLELPLEVLDDFFSEAREIHRQNPWLNYALPLHRCRELGYQSRLFDLLDERPLNKDEVKEFCTILFGKDEFVQSPDVHTHWTDFLRYLSREVKREKHQFNPMTKKMAPWIDMKELKRAFGGGVLGMFRRKSVA